MQKLSLAVDRSGSGVLSSDEKSRDIQIDSYTLSFHGRLLIDNASIALNYGRRYGLLGENGSGKTTFLQSLAQRDVEIPEHIDVGLGQSDWYSPLADPKFVSLHRSTSSKERPSLQK